MSDDKELKFLKGYYNKLLGGRIIETAVIKDEDEPWILVPVLALQMPSGEIMQLEVLSDPEGNDGGHIAYHVLEEAKKANAK